MNKCRVGDVYALSTKRGYALFQVVYVENNSNGLDVIRIIDGFADDANSNIESLAKGDTLLFLRFPISLPSVRKAFFVFVGNYSIPEGVKVPDEYKICFRSREGKLILHRVHPGTRYIVEDHPDEEYFKLSPWAGYSIPDIVEKLERGDKIADWI